MPRTTPCGLWSEPPQRSSELPSRRVPAIALPFQLTAAHCGGIFAWALDVVTDTFFCPDRTRPRTGRRSLCLRLQPRTNDGRLPFCPQPDRGGSRRRIKKTGRTSTESRYYLSTARPKEHGGEQWLELICGHWGGAEVSSPRLILPRPQTAEVNLSVTAWARPGGTRTGRYRRHRT